MIRIEIVYAEPDRAISKTCTVSEGTRIADVLSLAAADPQFSGVDLAAASVGVFGTRMPPTHELQDGDRVEIYRPLAQDPKVARRARARG